MQTAGNQPLRPVAIPCAQAGYDQRVLPEFALGMAASDPRQFGHQRFEDADRAGMVAFGEGLDAAAEVDRARTWSKLAVGLPRLHLRQSGATAGWA